MSALTKTQHDFANAELKALPVQDAKDLETARAEGIPAVIAFCSTRKAISTQLMALLLEQATAALQQRNEELEAEKTRKGNIYVKAHPGTPEAPNKRAIALYGLQRMPVSLHREQWVRLRDEGIPAIFAFIEEHGEYLPETKTSQCKPVPANLIGPEGKPFRIPKPKETKKS